VGFTIVLYCGYCGEEKLEDGSGQSEIFGWKLWSFENQYFYALN
jgi:hypothetical protein